MKTFLTLISMLVLANVAQAKTLKCAFPMTDFPDLNTYLIMSDAERIMTWTSDMGADPVILSIDNVTVKGKTTSYQGHVEVPVGSNDENAKIMAEFQWYEMVVNKNNYKVTLTVHPKTRSFIRKSLNLTGTCE